MRFTRHIPAEARYHTSRDQMFEHTYINGDLLPAGRESPQTTHTYTLPQHPSVRRDRVMVHESPTGTGIGWCARTERPDPSNWRPHELTKKGDTADKSAVATDRQTPSWAKPVGNCRSWLIYAWDRNHAQEKHESFVHQPLSKDSYDDISAIKAPNNIRPITDTELTRQRPPHKSQSSQRLISMHNNKKAPPSPHI